jgi:hypothetical protein
MSNSFGVWHHEDGTGVNSCGMMTTPAGISPSLSTTNDRRVDHMDVLLLSLGRWGSSARASVLFMCVEINIPFGSGKGPSSLTMGIESTSSAGGF